MRPLRSPLLALGLGLLALRTLGIVGVFTIFRRGHVCIGRGVPIKGTLGPCDTGCTNLVGAFHLLTCQRKTSLSYALE